MSKQREVLDFLEDAIAAMEKAERFVEGIGYKEFLGDEKTVFAVLKAIEVAGEAIKHIPTSFRSRFDNIPGVILLGGFTSNAPELADVLKEIESHIVFS